jgi:hypothetical protein
VTDYLTPGCAEKLLAAHGMSAGELNSSKASAAANLKRKTDWEQELEVRTLSSFFLLFILLELRLCFLGKGSSGAHANELK